MFNSSFVDIKIQETHRSILEVVHLGKLTVKIMCQVDHH